MIASFLLVTASLGGVTVTLPDTVEVRGTELTIGAIATVTGDDEGLVGRVREASLGYAPAPGYSRLLDRTRVAADLRRMLPSVDVDLVGAERTRVTPAVTTVSGARLLEASGAELRGLLADTDARITANANLADLLVPQAVDRLDLRVDLHGRQPRAGAWSVPVEVVVDGAVYRTIWTRWTVEMWARRQVLRRDVGAGERLTAGDFELARVPVGTGPAQHALEPSAFGHATLRRALPRGSVVTERDVTREVVVRRGAVVALELRRGGVSVRALASAERDGRVGDRIPVRLERTGKQLVAIVTGPETVVLSLK